MILLLRFQITGLEAHFMTLWIRLLVDDEFLTLDVILAKSFNSRIKPIHRSICETFLRLMTDWHPCFSC